MFPIRKQTAAKKKRKRLSHVLEDLTMMQMAVDENRKEFFHDNNNTKENRKMMQENGTDKPKHVNVTNLVPLAHLQNIMSPSTSDQHQDKSINTEHNSKHKNMPDLNISPVKDLMMMQMVSLQQQVNYFYNNNNTKEIKEDSSLIYMPSLFQPAHLQNSMFPSTSSIIEEKSVKRRSGKADSLSDLDIVQEKDMTMVQKADFQHQINYFNNNNNTKENIKIKRENGIDKQMDDNVPNVVPMTHLQKIMFPSTSPLLADQGRSNNTEHCGEARNFSGLAISQFNDQDTPLDLSMKRNSGGLLDMFFPPILPLELFHMQRSLSVPIVHGDVASSTTVHSVASRYNLDVSPVVEEMPPGSDAAVVCPICGQMFSIQHRLTKHMASKHKTKHANNPDSSTSKLYDCTICTSKFTRSDMLTRHMRLHTGLKPYECKVCGQVFSRSDHLATHSRTHTGEKPYKCPQCPYAACRRDMITRHLKTHSMRGSLRGSLLESNEENSMNNMSP